MGQAAGLSGSWQASGLPHNGRARRLALPNPFASHLQKVGTFRLERNSQPTMGETQRLHVVTDDAPVRVVFLQVGEAIKRLPSRGHLESFAISDESRLTSHPTTSMHWRNSRSNSSVFISMAILRPISLESWSLPHRRSIFRMT